MILRQPNKTQGQQPKREARQPDRATAKQLLGLQLAG